MFPLTRILLDSRDAAASAANPHRQSRAEDAGEDERGRRWRRVGRGRRRILESVSGRKEGAGRGEEGGVEEGEAEVARKRKQLRNH